jgi:hypothetical protein
MQGAETVLFADNTTILKRPKINILNKKINRIMKEPKTWLHANGLVTDTEKTIALPFHTWQDKRFLKPQIRFDKVDIKYKT